MYFENKGEQARAVKGGDPFSCSLKFCLLLDWTQLRFQKIHIPLYYDLVQQDENYVPSTSTWKIIYFNQILQEVSLKNLNCTNFVFITPSGQPPLALKHQLREKGMVLLQSFSNLGSLFY